MCQPWVLHFYPGVGGPLGMHEISLSLYVSMFNSLPE
jgi:hypothetical protein